MSKEQIVKSDCLHVTSFSENRHILMKLLQIFESVRGYPSYSSSKKVLKSHVFCVLL